MSIDEKLKDTPELERNEENNQSIMGKMADCAKSQYGRIATSVGAGLLALSLYALNPSTAKAEDTTSSPCEIEEVHRTELPSTEGWEYLGERDDDRSRDIPGEETILRGYEKENIQLIFAFYKGHSNPRSFWYYNTKTDTTFDTYVDNDNDRVFETYVPEGKSNIDYDLEAWGF